MKKFLLLVLVLIIALPAVCAAADFNVKVIPVDDKIYRNESAVFIIQIQNNRASNVTFTFSAPESISAWLINADPLTDYPSVTVKALKTRNVTLKLKPISLFMIPGTKKLTLKIASARGVFVESEILVLVLSEDIRFGRYYPNVVIDGMDIPAKIDPRSDLKFYFDVVNKNSLDLDNVVVEVSSRLVNKTQYRFAIGPYGQKQVVVTPGINKYAVAGADELKIRVIADEEVVKEYQRNIEILPVDLPYEYNENVSKYFLKSVYSYTVFNPSNLAKTELVKLPTSYWDRIFSWVKPKPSISKEGGQFFAWKPLPPGEGMAITIVRSYRPLMYFAIAVIVFLCIYYYFKPDLFIEKTPLRVVVKEGGLSESVIRLSVKNISGAKLENVKVVDTIPNIAEYVKEEKLGVSAPNSIRQYDISGTKLEWVFGELGPREERIITYKMVSKLKILGKFKLKPTEATFVKNGKTKSCFSNTLSLMQD